MPEPDVLETERLVLRRAREDDAVLYRQLWTERDPRVPPHRRIDADGHPTVDEVAVGIRADRGGPWPGLLTVVVREGGGVIGYCGLSARPDAAADEPELAYELARGAHGHGYATEAARAVVAWADEAGVPRLRAGVWDWNLASRRVLAKLGFHEVGPIEPTSVHGRTLLTLRDRPCPSS